jgi:very-short-patch-repair endonuclease
VHRAVYAVGHPALSERGLWKAATLAGGEGCTLSDRSAAELWAMLPYEGGAIHVTVPALGGRRARNGLRIHRRPGLDRNEVTIRDGIPVTRPERTVVDLRATAQPADVRRAVRQAEFLRLPLGDFVWERTASELEARFLRLCARAGLPRPEVNVSVDRFTVDFLWRPQRLIVETDGYRSHGGRIAFEEDRARDNRLASLGYEVLRFTLVMLTAEPRQCVALVAQRLSARH